MILLIATNKQIDRVLLTTNIGISPGLIFKLFITGEHFVKLFKNACTNVKAIDFRLCVKIIKQNSPAV